MLHPGLKTNQIRSIIISILPANRSEEDTVLNQKKMFISLFLFVSIALLFVGCIPTDSQLFFYSEKYDLFFPNFQQNVYQKICYKFALPFTMQPATVSIKGQLVTGMTIPPGQLTSKLEIIRKGHTIFSNTATGNYDGSGRFHGSFKTDNPAVFSKNDVIIFSIAPASQSFTNVHFKFTVGFKF